MTLNYLLTHLFSYVHTFYVNNIDKQLNSRKDYRFVIIIGELGLLKKFTSINKFSESFKAQLSFFVKKKY